MSLSVFQKSDFSEDHFPSLILNISAHTSSPHQDLSKEMLQSNKVHGTGDQKVLSINNKRGNVQWRVFTVGGGILKTLGSSVGAGFDFKSSSVQLLPATFID